jgi:hypothetical protein
VRVILSVLMLIGGPLYLAGNAGSLDPLQVIVILAFMLAAAGGLWMQYERTFGRRRSAMPAAPAVPVRSEPGPTGGIQATEPRTGTFCPQCGTPRVGSFRYCGSCRLDFDTLEP